MIKPQTYLNVADNTGAKKLMCIQVLGKDTAGVGDKVRAVVKRTISSLGRENGTVIRFDDNAAVVINKEGNPRGTRVFGPVARELREKSFSKIVSLAPEVL